jgi:CotS family spore coat protein
MEYGGKGMEQYVIKPWDTRVGSEPAPVDWDMSVPPEVDEIAEQVMKQYDMSVSARTLITSKPDKGGAIWRIETNKGPRSLKVLHRTPERSLFSVGFQEYVVKQGARVPALIPANDGKLFVEKGGKLWIVTDWIDLEPATKVDLVGAQELCYGLGEFHRHSKGYVPPFGAKNSSRLFRWPNYYQKIAKKIGWMREMASAYRDTAAGESILSVVDQYEKQALDSFARLKESAYPNMVAMGEPHWGLVHQDFGWSNGQNGPGGLWVIDLDGVAYDLPFRDLRKLITSTMDDMGVWDVEWMRGMIDAYHQANPLDLESYEVLLIDMSVPNEFYKHLKEMFFDPVTFLNSEADSILQRVVATDQSKGQALAELAKDKSKYASGNYEQALAARQPKQVASESIWDQKSWVIQPQEETVPVALEEALPVMEEMQPVMEEMQPVMEEMQPVMEEVQPVIVEKGPVIRKNVRVERVKSVEKENSAKAPSKPAAVEEMSEAPSKSVTLEIKPSKKGSKEKAVEEKSSKKRSKNEAVEEKSSKKRSKDEAVEEKSSKKRSKDEAVEEKSSKKRSKKEAVEEKSPKVRTKTVTLSPNGRVIAAEKSEAPKTASSQTSTSKSTASKSAETRKPVTRSSSSANNVIDMTPYLNKKRASAAVSNRNVAQKKTTSARQPIARKKAVAATKAKKVAKAVTIQFSIAKQATKARKQKSVARGNARKAGAANKHAFSKVPAPRKRAVNNQANKPRAKKGRKMSGGLR